MRVIGVTASHDLETNRLVCYPDYYASVFQAGALPVILPLTDDPAAWEEMLGRIDGLLLSGGDDVGPALYGEEKLLCCGDVSPLRDATEMGLCRLALEKDMPMLCICRGIQVLNVALGGTLYQDIGEQYGKQLPHPRFDIPRDKAHQVSVQPGTRLRQITGLDSFGVNSRHHQAIKDLAPGLVCSARAEDGLMEAVELPGKKFVVGVQWHPESLQDRYPEAKALFTAFAEACGV